MIKSHKAYNFLSEIFDMVENLEDKIKQKEGLVHFCESYIQLTEEIEVILFEIKEDIQSRLEQFQELEN